MHAPIIQATDQELCIASNHCKTVPSATAPSPRVDYHNKVCEKPWGHEFLVYENKSVAIWFLKIRKGHSTSLHCHFKKDTLLTSLSGTGKIEFFDNQVMDLPPLSSVFILRNTFHALSTFSDETTFLEIEVFDHDVHWTDKNDLLRINDQYVRPITGYESSVACKSDANALSTYGHFDLQSLTNRPVQIQGATTTLTVFDRLDGEAIDPKAVYVLLQGQVLVNGGVLKEGSILPADLIPRATPLQDATHLRVLRLQRPYADEDRKIIYDLDHLQHIRAKLHARHQRIVLTSGCFDIIHVGHLHHLKEAKRLGDALMVCLSNDDQIRKLKGSRRPINNNHDRLGLFKTIAYVDYIVLYNETNLETEETLGTIMKVVKPHVWTKGNDYTIDAILAKHPYLSRVVLIPNVDDTSTTHIVRKIMADGASST